MAKSVEPPADAIPLEEQGHRTFHLVPASHWQNQQTSDRYVPERFEDEGFIHCTDTIEEVVAVGNRYYQTDPRPYLLLEIDCDAVAAPIVYEDAGRLFPHIYGPLELTAVRAAMHAARGPDGRFLAAPGVAR